MATQAFKVLIVDDTDAQRYAVARTLRGQGFDVEEASTGAQALDAAKNSPDLILLDIVLPDIDGFEVCRRLKADLATAEIPVIQISANFVDPEHRVEGFRGGADDYIAQPITPEELVAKIGVWARIRQAEEELRLKNAELEAANAQLGRDIQARQLTEEALRENERQFRDLANAIPQLCWMAKGDGWIFWYNQRWFDYTGTTPEQMEGWGWKSVHDPNILPKVMERWKSSIASGERFEMIFPLRGADGVFRPFLTRIVPIVDEGGTVVRWFGTNTDITEQRRAEDALRKSEQRLRFHMENTPLAVIEWGADFRLSRWSGEAERMFGWRADEVIGKRMTDLRWIYEEDKDRVNVVSQGLRTGSCQRSVSSNRNYRKDGSVIYCEWYNSSLVDDSGKLVSIMSLVLDVTERQRAQDALVRSEKLASVGRMAASVAHEINNPLEAVMNLVFLAQNQKDCPKSVHEYLDTASTELKRISHVTRQVLGFYRGSAAAEHICVQSVLDDAIELFGSRIAARQINLERQYGKQVQIRAVSGELRQVFSNLLANSLEAVSPGGTIKVRVSESTLGGVPSVRITVSDNGTGIKRAAAPHVFEPLFTTKEAIGTGLGLWITKQLIEKHGGSIRFRTSTQPVHRGTTFSIVLPADLEHSTDFDGSLS